MPTTERVGTESAANKAIGGVPEIHYFDFASKGRGQVVRLLWEDAGIAYDDTRYEIASEYPKFKETQLVEWNPLATIPVIMLGGRPLTQSYALLRHFARQLGSYDGVNEEDKYWADAMCDAGIDWRTNFVNAFLSPNKETDYPKHCETTRKNFLKGFNQHLLSHASSVKGPYVVGTYVTYADFVIYQVCHDEGLTKDGYAGLKEYPRLAKLCEAVEQRPNVAAFLKSNRYRG